MLGRRSAIAKRSTAKPQTVRGGQCIAVLCLPLETLHCWLLVQVAEKLAARAKKFVQLRKTEKQKNQPSACRVPVQLLLSVL
jgi:hypothetical protein